MARGRVLVVWADGTPGWGVAATGLAESLRNAGVDVATARTGPLPRVRTFMATDLVEARQARGAAARAIAEHAPDAVIYCSITSALLWPRPGAIWLDATAAENRPGRHGIWQRGVERRRLREAPLVLGMSDRALGPLAGQRADAITLPVPVEPSGPPAVERDIAALTYAGNPEKKRVDLILAAWQLARRPGETLVLAGVEGIPATPKLEGVEVVGVGREGYRALLRRARVFVAAPLREDYGIAPLEALSDGCQLVTAPAPGAYPALEIARRIDPRLVTDDLARAIRIALDDPVPRYAERAAEQLAPFRLTAVQQTLTAHVLPRLLPAWTAADPTPASA
jgi:glycosyltransferase involved in cell wall biosynthesis